VAVSRIDVTLLDLLDLPPAAFVTACRAGRRHRKGQVG